MKINISVRNFVEATLKSGSIDSRLTTNARALEGIKAHQKLQQSNEEFYNNYEKEVYLKTEINMEEVILNIDGRCDGIIYQGTDVIIEEIKSTYKPLLDIEEDYNIMHWAQGKIYAYIVAKDKKLKRINVQLSYYNLETDDVKTFLKEYTYYDLEEFVLGLADKFKKYAVIKSENRENRNTTIKELKFPFDKYRPGQLELARACYGTIRDGKNIFIQAPTGIGKTISTIFPSIKAIGQELGEKIFYLTAKNVNKRVAEESLQKLRQQGLSITSISIVAKEKSCLNSEVLCNGDDCEYAKNYYDKVNDAILEILQKEKSITIEELHFYAKKYKICPFELSLDLIEWCDVIICDYNYIFDPRVYLRRVIDEEGEKSIILVDEAHNLIDRARNSYTAEINKNKFIELRRETRGIVPKLYKITNKINKVLIEEERTCQGEDKQSIYYDEKPKDIIKLLRIFARDAEEILTQNVKISFNDLLLDMYFEANNFISIYEGYGKEYKTIVETTNNEVKIILFCVDPSHKLKATMDKCKSTILFSATLSPFEYYIKLLGGNEEDYRLRLHSPYPKENLSVYLYKENTRYKYRKKTLPYIFNKIKKFIEEKQGNYMVFLPSYEYMNMMKEYNESNNININSIWQDIDMNEEDKEKFISKFTKGSDIVGFCVIGGMFSEGIDLPGEKLIGAIIIGVGYPKVSLKGEIIKEYFENEGEKIAYIYPGINKVMQAVGRVIRTESDKGRILLVDDRYSMNRYYNLLPDEWKPFINRN